MLPKNNYGECIRRGIVRLRTYLHQIIFETPNFDFVQRFSLEHTYQVPKLLVRIHFDVARPKG